MKRRKFIQQTGIFAAGCIWFPAAGSSFAVTTKPKPGKEFILAIAGPQDTYEWLARCLQPSPGIDAVRMKPGRAIRKKVSAVWLGQSLKKRIKFAYELLQAGIPPVLEAPFSEDPAVFDHLQKAVNTSAVEPGIALFHHYLPAVSKAREVIFAEKTGKILSVQVQINRPEEDPLLPKKGNASFQAILSLMNLTEYILAAPLVAVRVGSRNTASDEQLLQRITLIAATADFPVRLSNVPGFYETDAAWSILFTGEKSLLRLSAGNLLEIQDTSGSWKKLTTGESFSSDTAIRMYFEDFLSGTRNRVVPAANTSDMLLDSLLYQGIMQSILSRKTIPLMELPFGKSVRI